MYVLRGGADRSRTTKDSVCWQRRRVILLNPSCYNSGSGSEAFLIRRRTRTLVSQMTGQYLMFRGHAGFSRSCLGQVFPQLVAGFFRLRHVLYSTNFFFLRLSFHSCIVEEKGRFEVEI